jgi:hypothetical protein
VRRGLVFAFALVTAMPAAVMAQGDLAALAKKEKDRRAKVKQPAQVLTEENGKEAAARGTALITVIPEVAAPPPTAAPSQPSTKPDRASWKARADATRANIAATEQAVKTAETELAAFRADTTPVAGDDLMDPLRPQKREARIAEMTADLEAKKASVVSARKAMTELEEEARRAGVPPGWLR